MKVKALDVAAIVVSLAVVGAFAVAAWGGGPPAQVVVEASGARFRYPLADNRVERFAGPLGETVVEIRDGGARVLDSPCPDKLCVAAGEATRQGQFVACLPNRVSVSLEGRDGTSVDGTAF